jgi:hypothetical protein
MVWPNNLDWTRSTNSDDAGILPKGIGRVFAVEDSFGFLRLLGLPGFGGSVAAMLRFGTGGMFL